MFYNLSKQKSHFKRYRQITTVLVKNGLGFLIERLNLNKYLPSGNKVKDKQEKNKKNMPRRIRNVLEELGPTFIKFGQLVSTRPDILSAEYIKEFRKLQDDVPPVDFGEIEDILIEEMGEDYQENFLKIEKESQGAASIAQTHRAVLTGGREVILKIQRPDIKDKIKVDIDILLNFARIAGERNMFSDFIEPVEIVEEFSDSLLKELDFKREISNINKFRNNFNDNQDIIIPGVFRELSTSRIIVMERIDGIKLKQLPAINQEIDNEYLAKLATKAFFKQVLIDGFFHADPHPGNIYIVGDNKLAYIDFGIVGRLTPEVQKSFTILFIGLLKKSTDIILDEIIDIGIVSGDINEQLLKKELQELLDRYYGIKLNEIDFRELMDDFQRLIYKFHIRMPREFFLLLRAIAVSEGVGLLIDPALDITEVGNDFLLQLIGHKLKPSNLINKAIIKFWKFQKTGSKLPFKINKLVDKLSSDQFTIKFKHMNLDKLINKLDIISNRLSISLIVSALIIGSSMILQTDLKPILFNIPLLGLAGYIIAGVFGIILLIDIFRSGRY